MVSVTKCKWLSQVTHYAQSSMSVSDLHSYSRIQRAVSRTKSDMVYIISSFVIFPAFR